MRTSLSHRICNSETPLLGKKQSRIEQKRGKQDGLIVNNQYILGLLSEQLFTYQAVNCSLGVVNNCWLGK